MADYPELAAAISLPWIEVFELEEITEIVAFTRYHREFAGSENRDFGESAVLAWVEVHGGVALIDERVATEAGRRDGLTVQGSLWLIVEGHRTNSISREIAEQIVDDLQATSMRLPTSGIDLFAWAYKEGLLP
jgi:predicted nucleic acid-binding protein